MQKRNEQYVIHISRKVCTNEGGGVICIDGWIKLHRKLLDNPIFDKPELLQLFIYCLLKANHEPQNIIFNGQEIEILAGQFITGRAVMAKDLGQKPITTYKRLKILKNIEILNIESNNRFTLVTVVNYGMYQSEEIKRNSKSNNKGTTREQLGNTNKNDKNDKNDKNIYSSSHMTMAEKLKSFILSNNPGAKTPDDLSKWAAEFERMERLDKRSPEQIVAVMEFSQKDLFWKANILSAGKLREKFDTLLLQKDRPKPQQQSKTPNKANFEQRKYSDDDFEKLYKV